MTIAADTVALDIIFSRAFAYGLINNDEKVTSSKQHTQFKNRVQKPHPI